MDNSAALRAAISLYLMPIQMKLFREAPLPEGILELLYIAVGTEKYISGAVQVTERPRDEIESAVKGYIDNILLAPNSDKYRLLGADKHASYNELRRNMALMARYLHPDLSGDNERNDALIRVTNAWKDINSTQNQVKHEENYYNYQYNKNKLRKYMCNKSNSTPVFFQRKKLSFFLSKFFKERSKNK